MIITSIRELQTITTKLRNDGKTIGFVPTMGFLHEGHRALLQKAREENEIVILSIFVNPLQFGPKEDLSTYPRDLERDKKVALEEKVDYIFHPEVEEMYPNIPSVIVTVQTRTDVLCGSSRPGHFDGVATVLTKLFHIVQPNRAYFGNKDAQQVAVVVGMVADFHFPLQVVRVDTVRESDGLAKSSRNVKLLPVEREQAPILYKSLKLFAEKVKLGERNTQKLKELMMQQIQENTDGEIDYVEVLTYPDLQSVDSLEGTVIAALAVKFSQARLIDNIIIEID